MRCLAEIEIHVNKSFAVRATGPRRQIRTWRYSYHVLRRVQGRPVNLFRYDNVHTHVGHPDHHHKHTYGDDGLDDVLHVGFANWPSLGKVIQEACDIWIDFEDLGRRSTSPSAPLQLASMPDSNLTLLGDVEPNEGRTTADDLSRW